ncbi:hypothetical protein N7493_008647, partial [Penicillium malachiteum]
MPSERSAFLSPGRPHGTLSYKTPPRALHSEAFDRPPKPTLA